eukprot:m.115273 g.115273  ORF g.115273 m.115273 type:complete len:616 (-) comp15487_c0_seq1:59-1906(-)
MSFRNNSKRWSKSGLATLLIHEDDGTWINNLQTNEKAYAKPLVQTSALLRIILSVLLYYFDVVSDFVLMASLARDNDRGILAFVLIVIVARVVFVCCLDMLLAGGMGIKGVILNLFELRMLYYLGASCTKERSPVMTKRAAGDFGMIEAVFESLPQTLLQAYLVLSLAKAGQRWQTPIIIVSFAISFFRLMITVSGKLLTMFQRDTPLTLYQAGGVHLYFLADAISRSFAFAVFFLYSSGGVVALVIIVYIIIELLLLLVPERSRRQSLQVSVGELATRLVVGLLVSLPLTQRRSERWRVFGFSTLASIVLTLTVASREIEAQEFVLIAVFGGILVKVVMFFSVIVRFPDADVGITLGSLVLSPTDANRWSDEYWRSFIGHKRKLILTRRRLNATGISTLARVTKNNHTLRHIDVTNNLLGPKGCIALAHMVLRPNNLTVLSIRANQVDASACEILAEALQSSECQLDALDLYNNLIADEGMITLAAALPSSSLAMLNVGANDIGSRGAAALSQALVDPRCVLVDLSIWSNAIDSTGAGCLADALKKNKKLKRLSLYNNDITDDGSQCFEDALPENVSLSELNLGRNRISEAAVARLRAACEVNQTCYINVSKWF